MWHGNLRFGFSGRFVLPEQCREDDHHDDGEGGGEPPKRLPLGEGERVGTVQVVIEDHAGGLRADQHASAVGDKHEHALCLAANFVVGALVDVDLSGDKKEVVADAV